MGCGKMLASFEKEGVLCIEGTVEKEDGSRRKVYNYLVDGMLVDTGPQCLAAELTPFYEKHSLESVVLTHSHEDHSGMAPWIQTNWEIPIYVHPKGINICAERCPYPIYRQETWGTRTEFVALPIGETVNSRSKAWEVIYTPGHAEDHVALFHKETGRLFSGDLFVSTKTKVIMESESIPSIMRSIRKLLTYDIQSMYCGHAGYIPNGKDKLRQKLQYLEQLCDDVDALSQKGLSVEAIDRKIFPKKYPIVGISGGEWDSLHIVTSIVEHKMKKQALPVTKSLNSEL